MLNKKTNSEYVSNLKEDYKEFRTKFLGRKKKQTYLNIEQARERKFKIEWPKANITKPNFLGVKVIEDISLADLKPYIDWTPFFISWDLHGKFPNILKDEVVGVEATKLYKDASEMIDNFVETEALTPKAVIGLFEANTVNDDDISVKLENKELGVYRTIRQQLSKREGKHNFALADFIAPESSEIKDYIGSFCVSIFGVDKIVKTYNKIHDDYNAIMAQAIADRFAEALAEYLHERVRKEFWGYASEENLSNSELIKEDYKGIRPAPGYPACPDHLEKNTIWDLLKVEENIGVTLTESLAMWPAASVSGYYFGNEEAKYFGVGKITMDQVEDFANRKAIDLEVAKKWLKPNIIENTEA